jgi:hypothetical protein
VPKGKPLSNEEIATAAMQDIAADRRAKDSRSRTQAAEAYLTAVDRLNEKVAKLEAENVKLREQLEAEVRLRSMDFDQHTEDAKASRTHGP